MASIAVFVGHRKDSLRCPLLRAPRGPARGASIYVADAVTASREF
jgi:hypothetical protein